MSLSWRRQISTAAQPYWIWRTGKLNSAEMFASVANNEKKSQHCFPFFGGKALISGKRLVAKSSLKGFLETKGQ
jgi:hypothetical protein